jgi:hypothetical protein
VTNALDFHIAYCIGVLSNREPSAFLHVISKDSGFDPLIGHLKGKRIPAQRSASIAGMPVIQRAPESEAHDRIGTTIADLTRHQLSETLADLCRRGIVHLQGEKVTYSLPG